jgi:TOMM system kinase/cyclase fusion protein
MMSEGKDPEGERGTGEYGSSSASADLPTTRPAEPEDELPMAGRQMTADEPTHRLLGRVLSGRYRIESHLGAGGFGDVFRAVQEKTGQLVAIKVLRPRYGKSAPSLERQLARFRREMRVCAELHHAHIVRLIDSGETDNGLLFSVFEYVPGMTLSELLREKGALTVRSTIELMSQVLDALICAHGRGIIHRDLKPNNIMVSTTGSRPQTTVLDFGISAFREGMLIDEFKSSLTVTKEILGTPSYAAPEQLRGESASVKSDLYAWGLVFLECLLGQRVLDGASAHEIAYRQLSADPVPLPPRLQKHWLGVLLRWVLEKDVSRRAGDGALLLERLLEKRPLGDLVDAHGYYIAFDDDGGEATPPLTLDEPTSNSLGTQAIGERRQITAVCCTVALNAAAGHQPPELLDQLLRDALGTCLEIATRYGGYPASNLGGQVLIYFGFPRASDTDARRSGIVALEIAHELRRRTSEIPDMPVEIKIGIHTGMVTTLGLDARSSSPVFGVTPAQAVQLAAEAPSNGILVSSESFRTLAPSFELSPITSTRGQQVYRLVAESRAESAAASASAPFVGRQRELERLQAAWARSRKAEGATLLLSGEAGMGKSRLARELRQRLQEQHFGWIEARCLPEMQNSALRPVIDLLNQELNLGSADGIASARRLEGALRELDFDPQEAMPLLCPWLGLPLVEPYQPLSSSPQKQKALLLDLLVRVLMAIAERQVAPVLIEDLHWADPTTRELIDLLVGRVAGRRVLLLLTSRAELPQPFAEDLVELVELRALEQKEVEQIVGALTNGRHLPDKLVEDVVQRADGIPLFVEEIVHFLEEAEPSSSSSSTGSQTEVPGKLRDLLTGRLDRLGRAKETAQIAAVIGREFDYRLLASLVPSVQGEEALLLADLEKMVSADLVVRRRHVDNPAYMFRHALIRDAAYESLPRKVQQHLHQKIAEILAARFPEVAEGQPELMASHFERAGLVRESIDQWLRAGRRGLDRAANRETIAHMRRALALLDAIPDPAERARRELDLQLTLAPALMAIEGWASPATGAACTRARDLCQALEDQTGLFAALFGLWTFQFVGGNLGPALLTAQQTLALAEEARSPKLQIVAHHAVGFSRLYRAEFTQAAEHGGQGLGLYDAELERDIARSFQLGSTCCCAYFRAAALWMRGFPDDAEKGLSAMYALAHELGHSPTTGSIMGFALFLHHYQQDVERTRKVADELFVLSNEQGFQNWLAVSFIYRAWARTRQGELEQGIGELRFGIQQFRNIGARLTLVGVYAMLAEALITAGRPHEALEAIGEGIADAEERGEHIYEPELYRLRGEALRASNPAGAEVSFNEALRLCRQQEARSLSLRTAVGLARLLAAQGRKPEACALLQAECGWFTQGFGTADFTAARGLLDTLSSG